MSTLPTCIYVGDDLRDVQAGRAARMATAVAAWGYLGADDAIDGWGADHLLQVPGDLLKSAANGLNYPALGPTWLRRGSGFGTGHAEHQSARKSIWKQSNCERLYVRSRRLKPVSFATVGRWAGLEG